ncbi:hypothetical protein [Variovorax sp. MHTC-1]|uniref:hypothetical protein n=1 Tax=Variovorax sp. MHTC-1 TaxID=2495593 RepID=UPI00163CDF2C|nr:hypothetical protein [Variovorax sp. MHTC-1]
MHWYPAATARTEDYIQSAVKIDVRAKSALDLHEVVLREYSTMDSRSARGRIAPFKFEHVDSWQSGPVLQP